MTDVMSIRNCCPVEVAELNVSRLHEIVARIVHAPTLADPPRLFPAPMPHIRVALSCLQRGAVDSFEATS